MTDPSATMVLVTRDPLKVAQKQFLALEITTIGYVSIIISVPLGDTESALMAKEDFLNCRIVFLPSRPRGILDPTRTIDQGNTVGSVRIPVTNSGRQLNFTISFESFLVEQHAGPVDIELRGNDPTTEPLSTVQVVKSAVLPKIQSFTASSYNVIKGNRVTLSWTIDAEGDYELISAEKPADPLTKGKGKSASSGQLFAGDYTLKVRVGDQVVDTRCLRIHSFDATSFHSYGLNLSKDGSSTGILGLYAHAERGRLYALLRFGADAPRAQLWSTANGFDHDPATWQPETNRKGEVVSVTIEAARRPGVIFQDRLWLLGGDCCHPDKPGSNVGYYDFQETVWHEVGDDDPRRWPKEPKEMTERMGHAVVALPFSDRIWVMGGWSQNGGLCNDIWEFDGNTWKELAPTCEACLFGAAATSEAVWRIGGFASPGGAASQIGVRRYDKNNNETPVDFTIAKDMQYCASTLFALDENNDRPCGIGTFYDPETNSYTDKAFFISKERSYNVSPKKIDESSTEGVLLKRDYYHIQAAVFQGAAFLRMLRPDNKAAGERISYLVWVD